jgi:hypothetical protein
MSKSGIDRARLAQIVEYRWAQPADRRAGFAQRQADQCAGFSKLTGGLGGIVADGARCRVEPVRKRDQTLRDAVVDIACDAATFDFLGLDHLLDEKLVGPFPGHQLPV